MLKAIKIKGGKFTLPLKRPLKIQKMFANNTVELLTINDKGVERININKLKVYHHIPPTNVIIIAIIVDTRPNSKIGSQHRKKPNLISHLNTNQRIYLRLNINF